MKNFSNKIADDNTVADILKKQKHRDIKLGIAVCVILGIIYFIHH